MRLHLGGKYWHYRESRSITWNGTELLGLCQISPKREIIVLRTRNMRHQLDATVHEMLHALSWAHGEDSVATIAESAANILYAVGLRRRKHDTDSSSQPLIRELIYNVVRAANFHLEVDDGATVAARDVSKCLVRLGWSWREKKRGDGK